MDRRLKTRHFLLGLLLALVPLPLMAAGSVVVTSTSPGSGVKRYSIAWTSDAGGAVSGNVLADQFSESIVPGYIFQAQFIPGAGGTQPTVDYDVVLNYTGAVDFLLGAGANLSNTTSKFPQIHPALFYDGTGALDLVVSNAGNAKTGTLVLWVRP